MPGIAVQILLPLAILLSIPALLIASMGREAARATLLYYLPEISLWIVTGAMLTILQGLIKIRLLREATIELQLPSY
jgi:hypothetical protein